MLQKKPTRVAKEGYHWVKKVRGEKQRWVEVRNAVEGLPTWDESPPPGFDEVVRYETGRMHRVVLTPVQGIAEASDKRDDRKEEAVRRGAANKEQE